MSEGITLDMLEDALSEEGWDPEYKDAGDPLDYPSFEISVEVRTLYIEMMSFASDRTLTLVRICEYDENGFDFLDVWDVEELAYVDSVIEEIKDFLRSV